MQRIDFVGGGQEELGDGGGGVKSGRGRWTPRERNVERASVKEPSVLGRPMHSLTSLNTVHTATAIGLGESLSGGIPRLGFLQWWWRVILLAMVLLLLLDLSSPCGQGLRLRWEGLGLGLGVGETWREEGSRLVGSCRRERGRKGLTRILQE